MSIPCTSGEVLKLGRKLSSAKVAREAPLGQVESCEREARVVRKAADAKLTRANKGADELVELQKWQVVPEVSVQELTAELEKVKAKLVKVAAEMLEFSTKLNVVEAVSHKRLEELAVVRGARDRFKGLLRFIVGQSAEALDALVNQVVIQLGSSCHRRCWWVVGHSLATVLELARVHLYLCLHELPASTLDLDLPVHELLLFRLDQCRHLCDEPEIINDGI